MKVPIDDLAHEIWAAAQTAPGEGIEDAVERVADLLAREAVKVNTCESRASTHADDCWSWGPGHYKCAVREIARLRKGAA